MRVQLTPSDITELLVTFAATILGGDQVDLQFVPITTVDGAKPNRSHDNVRNYLKSNDGEATYCWAFYENACWIEAEFHSLIRLPDGTLLDITPAVGITRRLIAIDKERVLGQFRTTHKYQAKTDGEVVAKLLDLKRQRNQLFYRYSDGIKLNQQDAESLKTIESETEVVVKRLLQLVPDLVVPAKS